jgi:hypothetical protein
MGKQEDRGQAYPGLNWRALTIRDGSDMSNEGEGGGGARG